MISACTAQAHAAFSTPTASCVERADSPLRTFRSAPIAARP